MLTNALIILVVLSFGEAFFADYTSVFFKGFLWVVFFLRGATLQGVLYREEFFVAPLPPLVCLTGF